jgi:anti-sigma factor RsiW
MIKTWREIGDIDILAYADGLLEADAVRKAAVEAYLEKNPLEAERVAAIVSDNQELRELYAGELARPIPERHLGALYASARARGRMPRAIAASVVLIIIAAVGGWLFGRYDADTSSVSDELLQVAARHSVSAPSARRVNAAGRHPLGETLQPLSRENIWLGIRLPDLSTEGFELVNRQRLASGDREITQLVYRADGMTLNLFVRPRGEDTAGIRQAKVEGRTVHYWPAGPVAFALTTDADDQHAKRLADRVRKAMDQSKFAYEPPVTVPGPEKRGEAMAGDGTFRAPQLNTAAGNRKTTPPPPKQLN